MKELLDSQSFLLGLTISVMILAVLTMLLTVSRVFLRPTIVSYRVAMIGLPRAGKTSLIGAIFDALFQSTYNKKVSLSGEKTISHVNRIISILEQQKPMPPTTEGDIFAFRFVYRLGGINKIFQLRHEVEVADFPGEYSQELLKSAESGNEITDEEMFLINRDYLGWITHSRVLVFVIDAYELTRDPSEQTRADLRAKVRATYQSIQEIRAERGVRSAPQKLMLVFTKCDLLQQDAEKLPLGMWLDDEEISKEIAIVKREFGSVIEYLQSSSRRFSVHYTSSYASSYKGRYGVPKLLSAIMP